MLVISPSPHIHDRVSVARQMWLVVMALLPALAVAIWTFGIPAIEVTAVSLTACCLTEWLIARFMLHQKRTLLNGSAVITGLLLAFNLPSILPLWMVAIGGVVAIGIGKMSFGGLGCNIWNPALVGRVFLLISFPAAMTTWPVDVSAGCDATSGATMLHYLNYARESVESSADMMDMAVGHMNGSLGETGSIAILAGCLFLIAMRVISWHIPVATLGGAALLSWALGGNPALDLLSGGLMLGACFMATDYVTSPMTKQGQILFGVCIGALTIVIRRYGAYPEGVSFAILIMNSFVPLINRGMRPRIFGEGGCQA